jgi:hypothetical protein
VAITAFVGKGAESYLPRPEGITLVCWPKAGGTNPAALRTLMKRKVEVLFSDQLHMKVYWAEGRGCVLTSANLSTSALGSGNLKEAGILIGSTEIDIDALLSSFRTRPVTEREMKKLDRAHARFTALNQFQVESSFPTFMTWCRTPMRTVWKLGWFDCHRPTSKAGKARAKEDFGITDPANSVAARPKDYRRDGGEWILTFSLARDSPTDIGWMFSNYVVDVSPRDKHVYERDFPCEAVQVWPLSRYPGRPFRIDSSFRKAFRTAMGSFGADRIRRSPNSTPPEELIRLIAKTFEANEEG